MIQSAKLASGCVMALAIACSGCGTLSTDYGKSKGASGRAKLNGFGALRESYERAGYRNRDISRLTDRVMKTDVIVWTPQVMGAIDTNVTRWFERWLSRGNHTLVYVVPDSGSEADYWQDAAKLAPPPQRLEYRRRAAKSINERMMWRLNRTGVQSNGWFRIAPQVQRQPIGQLNGPWKGELGDSAEQSTEIGVEYHVVAFDPKDNSPAATFGVGPMTGPTGPGTPNWAPPATTTATRTPTTLTMRLATESGDPIVAEVNSKNWKNSRIIVVAGGSLLTNYAFTRSFNRQLAAEIIQQSTPAKIANPTAGFLSSYSGSIAVSENKPGIPEATGMELLTVWPMSLVTMHGVMLGLVICLMLLPIFGRPRRIARVQESDFGHHLDAVAALMNKAGGEQYARVRISDYFKRMHGETSGPWILPDRASELITDTESGHLNTLTPKRLTRDRATSVGPQADGPQANGASQSNQTDAAVSTPGSSERTPAVETTTLSPSPPPVATDRPAKQQPPPEPPLSSEENEAER